MWVAMPLLDSRTSRGCIAAFSGCSTGSLSLLLAEVLAALRDMFWACCAVACAGMMWIVCWVGWGVLGRQGRFGGFRIGGLFMDWRHRDISVAIEHGHCMLFNVIQGVTLLHTILFLRASALRLIVRGAGIPHWRCLCCRWRSGPPAVCWGYHGHWRSLCLWPSTRHLGVDVLSVGIVSQWTRVKDSAESSVFASYLDVIFVMDVCETLTAQCYEVRGAWSAYGRF